MKKSAGFERLKNVVSTGTFGLVSAFSLNAGAATQALTVGTSRTAVRSSQPFTANWHVLAQQSILASTTTTSSRPFYNNTLQGDAFHGYLGPGALGLAALLKKPLGSFVSETTNIPILLGCVTDCGPTLTFAGSTANYDWAIYDAMVLIVDGDYFEPPGNTVDVTDNEVSSPVTGTVPMSGLDVSVKYTYLDEGALSDRAIARAMFTLTNPSNNPISTEAVVFNHFQIHHELHMIVSSDGNLSLDDDDGFFAFDDINFYNSQPSFIMARFGKNAAVKSSNMFSFKSGLLSAKYEFTVPAQSTVRIVNFLEIDPDDYAAIAQNGNSYYSGHQLEQDGLLEGMTAQEKSEMINYNTAVVDLAPSTPILGGSISLMNIAWLAMLSGLFSMLRIRRPR